MMSEAEWEEFNTFRRYGTPFHMRGAGSKSVRKALWKAQHGVCGICGYPILDGEMRTVDHVIPKAMGGADMVGNFVIAHSDCNSDKAARPPNGCELVWLLAVNARIGFGPQRW